MLRASKVYGNGVIRSNVISSNKLGTVVLKRYEGTVTTGEKKSGGSILGKLVGITALLGSFYAAGAYYATVDKEFNKAFKVYVPGGEQAIKLIENPPKTQDFDVYRDQAADLKKQAEKYTEAAKDYAESLKGYGSKIQDTTSEALNYATDVYHTLTGQKEPAKLPVQSDSSPAIVQVEKATAAPNNTSKITTITADQQSQPALVTIEKPKPIIVKSIQSENSLVCELSQIISELASILNDSGLSEVGRDIITTAEEHVRKLNTQFVALDAEQESILKSLEALRAKGDTIEGSLEKFNVEAHHQLEEMAVKTASQIIEREAQLKNQFEITRADMKKTFAQKLAEDLKAQQQRLEKARSEALLAQSQQLQRQFVKEVKYLVEKERAGRLAKLDVVDKRFRALEKYSLQNAESLDVSRQSHVAHVAIDSLKNTLQHHQRQPFVDELQALSMNTKDDEMIQTALKVIPKNLAEEGVNTIPELSNRFEEVSHEIRQVALVPEDGGFGSHVISILMSYLMFQKSGLVEGDDVEAVLARTDYYLKKDNLEYATRELNQLTGWPKRLAQDWIQSARRHLEVKQALEDHLKDGLTIVVLGASGDLAKKLIFPALYALYQNEFLPKKTQIVGYARSKMNKEEFNKRILTNLVDKDDKEDIRDDFLKLCSYVNGQYDEEESWKKLNEYIGKWEDEQKLDHDQRNRIFYMALPPSVFIPVTTGLKKFVYGKEGKTFLVAEKPFGKDLQTCKKLLEAMGSLFKEKQIYRIDHYLGKEMVKNIMSFRFSNMIFNSLWNGQKIDSVQITLKEPFGAEGRGGYFDENGIIRDVMQNHLLQLMSLIGMERPIGRDTKAIRDEKVKLLKCVKPISLDDTLLGQYTGNDNHPGYLDDKDVPDDSLCCTFAALVLWVDNERWDNVPFILKAGKGLDNAKVEIRIQFQKIPGSLFSDASKNELVLRVQPGEAVYMKFNNKSPGFSYDSMLTELDLTYKKRYKNLKIPSAYENLILDILRGDHSNFVRDDELEAAWKIFTPLLHTIEKEKIKPKLYPFGTRGPKELNAFVHRYGVERNKHEEYEWPLQKLAD
ncbi:glucose-6-phosphate dehydrogenase [Pilobolus umbonatus]|nr:glucose-6-phosphate dehydrogenase [Pilobolus umbonatus]